MTWPFSGCSNSVCNWAPPSLRVSLVSFISWCVMCVPMLCCLQTICGSWLLTMLPQSCHLNQWRWGLYKRAVECAHGRHGIHRHRKSSALLCDNRPYGIIIGLGAFWIFYSWFWMLGHLLTTLVQDGQEKDRQRKRIRNVEIMSYVHWTTLSKDTKKSTKSPHINNIMIHHQTT